MASSKKKKHGGQKDTRKQGHGRVNPPKNPEFSKVVKLMYRLIQTIHHKTVISSLPVNELPPALQRKKAEMDRFWKPSSSNVKIQDKFRALSQTYMVESLDSMKTHYEETADDLAHKLKLDSLSLDDFEKARNIATGWAKKNYRKKLSNETLVKLNTLCEEIANKRTKSGGSQKSGSQPKNLASTKRGREVTPPSSPSNPLPSPLVNEKRQRLETPSETHPDPPKSLGPQSEDQTKSCAQLNENHPAVNTFRSEEKQTLAAKVNQTLDESVNMTPKRKRVDTPPNSPSESQTTPFSTPPSNPSSPHGTPPIGCYKSALTSPSLAPPAKQQALPSVRTSPRAPKGAPKRSINVFSPETKTKTEWKLPQLHFPTVYLGDSNLKRITKVHGSSMHILSYPGGKFSNIFAMLKNSLQYRCVKNVIISLGINERGNNVKNTSSPLLKRLIEEAKRVFPNAQINMASMQWNPLKLSSYENKTLEDLQVSIEKSEDINVISKLNTDSFKIDPVDKTGIHWSKETANAMIEHWAHSLN